MREKVVANTGTACGVTAFLSAALALLPPGMNLRCVRADSGFFEEARLAFLEQRQLPSLVVARMTTRLKRRAAVIHQWQPVAEHYAVGEFRAKSARFQESRSCL